MGPIIKGNQMRERLLPGIDVVVLDEDQGQRERLSAHGFHGGAHDLTLLQAAVARLFDIAADIVQDLGTIGRDQPEKWSVTSKFAGT